MPNDNGRVPKDPAWCSHCITDPKELGDNSRGPGSPCPLHRGPNGEKIAYAGHDVYEPTPEVLAIVGQQYKYYDGSGPRIYECFGYDPRHGFWMRTVDEPKRQTNVSERAIGASFHKVQREGPTRAEHMRWCKERAIQALEYKSNPMDAISSLASDFMKHDGTKDLRELVVLGMMTVRTVPEARKFVEDFAE